MQGSSVDWRLLSDPEWSELVRGPLAERGDVYFSPEYAWTCERGMHDGVAKCLQVSQDHRLGLFPFMERTIPNDLGATGELRDAITPYGYGGLIWDGNEEIGSDLWALVRAALTDLGYVSVFVRWHPLLDNCRIAGNEPVYARSTLAVDLAACSGDPAHFWKKQSLQQVHQAERRRLRFELLDSPTQRDLAEFGMIYRETMQRVGAADYYMFGDDYEKSLEKLCRTRDVFLAKVTTDGQLAAECMLLGWQGRYLHYHLSASRGQFLRLRPNHLLLLSIERWAQQQGYNVLHLGGGVTAGDGLEQFKRSVSNAERRFYVSKIVLRPDVYGDLVRQVRAHASRSSTASSGSDFFPGYRCPPE